MGSETETTNKELRERKRDIVRERECELTERGRRAGGESRRVRTLRRLLGALRSRRYRRCGAAPDPPERARSECGACRVAFFEKP